MIVNTQKELKKWTDKAIYDVAFRKDTKANLSRLDDIMKISLEHFVTIAANSEPLVYKIGRYYIEKGFLKCDDITFLSGDVLAAYIADESAEWKQKDRLDELFQTMSADFKGHWIFIPLMEFEISISMCIYLMSQFKKVGANGLIVCADGENFFTQVMVQQVHDKNLYQFPLVKYNERRKKLVSDEW